MNRLGQSIKPTGRCYLCGCALKAGTICFDCNDTNLTKKELAEKVFTVQKAMFEQKGKCSIKPIEGEDYFIQHEAIIFINAYGTARAIVDEGDGHDEIMNRVESRNIEWDEIDIEHTEYTGKTRKVDIKGNPFDENKWLKEKLTGIGKHNDDGQSPVPTRPLSAFQSEGL